MNLLEKFREINEVWILDFKDPKKEQNYCTEISNRFTNYFEKHNLELVDCFDIEEDCYLISHPKYNAKKYESSDDIPFSKVVRFEEFLIIVGQVKIDDLVKIKPFY